jgi:hypothetical protein
MTDQCPTCKKYLFGDYSKAHHKCAPIFWVINNSSEEWAKWDEPVQVRGVDAEGALIQWAFQYDSDEYDIAHGEQEMEMRVFTQQQYEDATDEVDAVEVNWLELPGEVFKVTGEFVPSYYAERQLAIAPKTKNIPLDRTYANI